MNVKYLVFALLAVAMIVLIWFLGNSPKLQNQAGSEPGMKSGDTQMQSMTATAKLPTVEEVTVALQKSDGDTLPSISLKPGDIKKISGTPYSISATDFYTHWNWNKRPINISYHEFNPAVKVIIYENSKEIYTGWAFKNMPFFRMKQHMDQGNNTEGDDRMAFTLLSYEGLNIPGEKK